MGFNCDSVPSFPQHSDFFLLGLTICPTHLNPYSQMGAGTQAAGGAAVMNTASPGWNLGQGGIILFPSPQSPPRPS